MEATNYVLEDASRLTGLSTEALRKRWMRGKLRGSKGNDGKVRVYLDDEVMETLRKSVRPDGQEPDGEEDESPTISALSRLADAYEQQAAQAREDVVAARQEAAQARAALDSERVARDDERRSWTGSLDRMAEELAATRERRETDRRTAVAAVRRIRQEAADLKHQLDQVLAGQVTASTRPPGLLARLARAIRPRNP